MLWGARTMRFAVKEMREKSGLTSQELSEKSGVALETILELEENKTDICNTREICNIADALGIKIDKLFFKY